ncbi:hypothetical protein PAAG_11918 [Paracoccidioides lutzii Pb01]|uniref:Uncharacterized protein n=1 Tax=Paracoccidioides lutzii (strain ATCC MYA-826 / Pb01) TaxID=502779 RepID=A0A0A2V0L1_PARBA|nr:hypothetical protein PAAG_11918 [Paracoccidioides lutzii Pb01]KGQ01341.1 hypothetical protein PAAG_11918 [Paracoccidioides lutzii Pb01]
MAGKSSHVRIAENKMRPKWFFRTRPEGGQWKVQQDLRAFSEQRTHKRTGGWGPENGDNSPGGLNNGWQVGLMTMETIATEQIGAKRLAIGARPKAKRTI